jgi:hypothetical protein
MTMIGDLFSSRANIEKQVVAVNINSNNSATINKTNLFLSKNCNSFVLSNMLDVYNIKMTSKYLVVLKSMI